MRNINRASTPNPTFLSMKHTCQDKEPRGRSPKKGESPSYYQFDSESMLSDADDVHTSHRDQDLASCDAEETKSFETSARGEPQSDPTYETFTNQNHKSGMKCLFKSLSCYIE
jgi:hypothetical protein